ncbi:RNA polymerase sigma factor SigM [Gordonia pseudamarae]|jgi:RNA polymerase sigma-70 factor (ECF subfamily)|uniref:RNA polymerase sigma factor SigM n=1 Tax=Gordonia pseudamarae TaxID=2831662 RepID=A0ABX6IP98_9ACTN|nr:MULTISPECIES: RNA polymerase sigma factor SigM [Gordonia]MBD0024312.1 RNA polymerase sigma factor SigM [Gordonia sp. (in: high G+C Gram-positive bacteria)]QHN28344.1 RNA polymerase sigma factor SigM [Gordonia pseudamarae]QHN37214.1 RNA polymerase sigma factor SigM [Gordonia pseudamarae]
MHTTEDENLLTAHVRGDPDAFTTLIERHHNHLWAVALRTCGNPHDAADALQEALISAYQDAGQFRGEGSASTWLHRIVVNCSLDRLRRNKLHRIVPIPDADTALFADPSDQMAGVDLSLSIGAALHQLTDDQRAVIIAIDVEGRPLAEVARRLDLPVGTIKSRSARARARMARLLGHLVDPDMDAGGIADARTPQPT